MVKMAAAATVVVVVVMAMYLTSSSALSCGEVDLDLLPCLNYVRSGGNVPSICCSGLSNLKSSATTTDDRRTACKCLKTLAQQASGDELTRAVGLPDKCGIPISFKIGPTTDCSQIN